MKLKLTQRRLGAIVVETISITAAIGLLALIALPVYVGRNEAAQLETAETEVRALARAQLEAARVYGVYLPLQTLDDARVDPSTRTDRTDDWAGEPDDLRVVDPSQPIESQIGEQIALGSNHPKIATMISGWQGPLYQSRRVYLGEATHTAEPFEITAELIRRDYPLDPWGNPYRFYSPIGLIGSRADQTGPIAFGSDEFSDGTLTRNDDRFDSFAIVSFGMDGMSDSVSRNNDDVIYFLPEG